MPNVDFTLADLKGLFATKEDFAEINRSVQRIAVMLEEDARAESSRLDRVETRSLKTQKMVLDHIASKDIHRLHG